jgi:hypothetical protein
MGCCYSIPKESALATFTTTKYPPDLSQILGGIDKEALDSFMENAKVSQKYSIVEGIASGNHWSAVLAKRTDGKQV